jgi:hypothetical protein
MNSLKPKKNVLLREYGRVLFLIKYIGLPQYAFQQAPACERRGSNQKAETTYKSIIIAIFLGFNLISIHTNVSVQYCKYALTDQD